MNKEIFIVTITGWAKHNKNKKRNHRYFLFSNGFFGDSKVSRLNVGTCLTYVWLITVCSETGEGHNGDTFECHTGQMPDALRTGGGRLEDRLSQLQQLQLVSYEKKHSLNNTIQENTKEKNTIQDKFQRGRKTKTESSQKKQKSNELEKNENRLIKQAYFDAYRLRYGIDPSSNATFNTQVSNLRKKLGTQEAIDVVTFYLTHNDSWYVKKTHSFGLCLSDADTLRTQMLKGKAITSRDVKDFEKTTDMQRILKGMETDIF